MSWARKETASHEELYELGDDDKPRPRGDICCWVVLDGFGTVRWLRKFGTSPAKLVDEARRMAGLGNDVKARVAFSIDLKTVASRLAEEHRKRRELRQKQDARRHGIGAAHGQNALF